MCRQRYQWPEHENFPNFTVGSPPHKEQPFFVVLSNGMPWPKYKLK
jgi:hypothetical protein